MASAEASRALPQFDAGTSPRHPARQTPMPAVGTKGNRRQWQRPQRIPFHSIRHGVIAQAVNGGQHVNIFNAKPLLALRDAFSSLFHSFSAQWPIEKSHATGTPVVRPPHQPKVLGRGGMGVRGKGGKPFFRKVSLPSPVLPPRFSKPLRPYRHAAIAPRARRPARPRTCAGSRRTGACSTASCRKARP